MEKNKYFSLEIYKNGKNFILCKIKKYTKYILFLNLETDLWIENKWILKNMIPLISLWSNQYLRQRGPIWSPRTAGKYLE